MTTDQLKEELVEAAIEWYQKITRDSGTHFGRNALDQDLVIAVRAYLTFDGELTAPITNVDKKVENPK